MDLKDAERLYEEKYDRSGFMFAPKVYMLRKTEEGSFILTDQSCKIPEKKEWEVIKKIINEFYKNATDDEIEEFNKEQDEESEKTYNREKAAVEQVKKLSGYVYFLKADNGLTKIGCAKDLNKRLDHFTAKLPYKLELVHSFLTDDRYKLEEFFHQKFAQKRKRGEWFDLSKSDIEEVKAYVGC